MVVAEALGVLVLLFLLLLLVAVLVYLGWRLAIHQLRQQRDGLRSQRDALDAEWRALDNTRRVREVFLAARRAMQREAGRQYRRGQSGPGAS